MLQKARSSVTIDVCIYYCNKNRYLLSFLDFTIPLSLNAGSDAKTNIYSLSKYSNTRRHIFSDLDLCGEKNHVCSSKLFQHIPVKQFTLPFIRFTTAFNTRVMLSLLHFEKCSLLGRLPLVALGYMM